MVFKFVIINEVGMINTNHGILLKKLSVTQTMALTCRQHQIATLFLSVYNPRVNLNEFVNMC